ncbi:MAG: hypothetical protein H0W31_11630 [Actinobacteria bacterium]|nr:hypothetical protein [Actinomycetota bacterium]
MLRHDDRLPAMTVLVRVEAPNGGCWSATIEDDVRNGCGSLAFPLVVEGSVSIFMERLGPAERPITAMIEVDGQVVQTVGPTTTEYPTFDNRVRGAQQRVTASSRQVDGARNPWETP